MKRILIIEDDAEIAGIERDYLELAGYETDITGDGAEGMRLALTGDYALILLDVMLPGVDGFEICRRIRGRVDVPIIIVSARRSDIDKIRGLGFGADVYVEKPFSPGVLVARVKSQIAQYERLKEPRRDDTIRIGDIALDPSRHVVTVRGREKCLPNKEFKLLEFLMINADHVFSREDLYTRIWGMDPIGNTATVPVHINRICEAVEEDPANPKHIVNIWGVGYKFKP